jgi:hypothetical protein
LTAQAIGGKIKTMHGGWRRQGRIVNTGQPLPAEEIRMNKRAIFAIASLTATMFVRAADAPDVREIVGKIDRLYRQQSSYALMSMEITTPHWQRTLRLKAWSQGMEKFLVRILEPKKEMGIASLKIGAEMWNYLPKTGKVIRIPPSMMMGSWMGSDFTNDDLVKEYTFLQDYTFRLLSGGGADPLLIECIPRPNVPVVWGKIVIGVSADDDLPVFQRYFDEKGQLVREIFFREVRNFGGHRMPAVMDVVSRLKPGNRTVIRYLEADFRTPLPRDIFSLSALQSGR